MVFVLVLVMKIFTPNQQGFSLLEITITLFVAAILFTAATPMILSSTRELSAAYEAECLVSDLRSLQEASRTTLSDGGIAGFSSINADYVAPTISLFTDHYTISYKKSASQKSITAVKHYYLPGITMASTAKKFRLTFGQNGMTEDNLTINIYCTGKKKPQRTVIVDNAGRIRVGNGN